MDLSVVIPTHGRAAMLQKTLAAIGRQTLPLERFEVIVVDDGSPEECRSQIRGLEPSFAFTYVEKQHGGLASARNCGAGKARGRVLLFLDDDVVPHEAAFSQHLAGHETSRVPIVVIGALPYPDEFRVDCFLWYLDASAHFDLYKDPAKYPGGSPPLPPLNGNSSLPRESFDTVGGYDETFSQYGGEDLELGYRLARAGLPFVYNSAAIGYHHHTKGFARFLVDQERAGESLVWIYRKYPEIRVGKKIDVMEDPFSSLSARKKLVKLVMVVSVACPWLQWPVKLFLLAAGRFFFLRRLLFPLYRWLGHTAYARGALRELRRRL